MTLLTWEQQSRLNYARAYHTANTLSTDKILIAGGQGGLKTCELYDIDSKTYTVTDSMKDARFYHTSVELDNGKIMVMGGFNGFNDTLNSCEIFDPTTELWTTTASMNYKRYYHTSTLLDDGRVLVAGGYGYKLGDPQLPGTYLTSCEIYDPSSETWTETGSLNEARNQHGATLLSGGNVLVAGGINKTWNYDFVSLDSAEIFDVGTETWTEVSSMNHQRDNVNLILMPNSKVFASGGSMGQEKDTYAHMAEIYDANADTWTLTSSNMTYKRHYHLCDMLNDNQILIVGGYSYGNTGGVSKRVEIYDILTDSFSVSDNLEVPSYFGTLTEIDSDHVLYVGGVNGGYTADSQVFDAVDLEDGIYKIKVDGYYNDDVDYFATATVLLEGPRSSFEIDTIEDGGEDYKSVEWKGYFKPNFTGTHTFYINSDDAAYLWIGDEAVTGFTTGNALVNNGGLHGTYEVSATIYLVKDLYVPIRIQFGENGGGAVCEVYYSHASQAKTQDFTNLLFYNVDTNGF